MKELVFGQTLQLTEDGEVEFKGSGEIMHEATVMQLAGAVVQTITAYLNTNGGSIYIGVHDRLRAVHGIQVDDIDKFMLRWDGIIKSRIVPRADHLVKIIPQPVVTKTTLTINEMRNMAFRKKIERPVPLPQPVYVLQFLVLPAADGLYFADNVAYRRNDGANAKLGPEQLEQYYFARFQQECSVLSRTFPS